MRTRMIQIFPLAVLSAVALLLSGCKMGPNYARPEVDLPKSYAVVQASQPMAEKWWTLFDDPHLNALIDEALANNRDLLAAAERIEKARADVRIVDKNLYPDFALAYHRSRDHRSLSNALVPPPTAVESNFLQIGASSRWELDFWGKFRRESEMARAALAASEAGRDIIRTTLIGEVTNRYFNLRTVDTKIAIAKETLKGITEAMRMQKVRYETGSVSEFELGQVEARMASDQALYSRLEAERTILEGVLALLAGRSPREVFEANIARQPPKSIGEIEVPEGLPSELLQRRPDIREAEANLQAANARIGVVRASYFPTISLTGIAGFESLKLANLFTDPSRAWSLAMDATLPINAPGLYSAGLEVADSQYREAALQYQQAVANAFREVRQAILNQSYLMEVVRGLELQEKALKHTVDLGLLRYEGGTISLFEYLSISEQLLRGQLETATAQEIRCQSIVNLYQALGG